MKHRFFGVGILLGAALASLMVSGIAAAQVPERGWYVGASSNPLPTERAAQLEIVSSTSLLTMFGPISLEVSRQVPLPDKTLYIVGVKDAQIERKDWVYKGQQSWNSLDEMLSFYREGKASNGICRMAIPDPSWTSLKNFGNDPKNSTLEEWRTGVLARNHVSGTDRCIAGQELVIRRERVVKCPNTIMKWDQTRGACTSIGTSAAVVGYYTTSTIPKMCYGRGNPCDPTTGDKNETHVDLALPWVRFERTFHSLTSAAKGGFGKNWSHSHSERLFAGPNPLATGDTSVQVGLISSDGSQLPFKAVGSQYEATDGSGDRAALVANEWVLYRRGEVTHFNTAGVLQLREFEDGTWLQYGHDAQQRLITLTHSTGRQVQLAYQGVDDGRVSTLRINGALFASYAYGPNAQLVSVTYAGGGARTYHYEDTRFPDYLTGVSAEDGRRYSWFAYDDKGRVTCSRHDASCDSNDVGIDGVRLQYNADGNTVVTDALGRQTSYRMSVPAEGEEVQKVTKITEADGAFSQTYFPASSDFRRRLRNVTDKRGTVTKHAYSQGNDAAAGPVAIHTITEASGTPSQRVSVVHASVAANRVVLERIGNRETRTVRNARLQPTTITVRDTANNQTRTSSLVYCEALGADCPEVGLIRTIDGPRADVSDVTTFAYYAADDAGCTTGASCGYRRGDLRSVTNGVGQSVEVLAYDAFGRPLSMKDANGVITDKTYHPRGWLTSMTVRGSTSAGDRITEFSYWPTGKIQQVTEPDGGSVTYLYDSAQRLTDIADSAGNSIHYTLDSAGNRLKEDTLDDTGTLRRTLSRIYNTLGQLTTAKDAGGHATGFTYDADGNPSSVTDALQRVTTQQYDPLGRLVRTLQDVGGINAEIRSTYNALDQVAQVTDPKGLNTTYTYNGFGDLTAQNSPDSGGTAFTLDAAGNRKTRTDARGVTATYSYDAINRLIGIAYPDPNLDVGYNYDIAPIVCDPDERFGKGRVGTVLHANGSTAYCYDRFGQVTRKVQTVNGVATSLRFAYSHAGRLAALTYPDGSVADYVRDNLGRVSEIGVTRPGQARQVVINQLTHAAFGPATGWTYGNGRQLQRPLDLDYRPHAVHDPAAGGLSLSFGYDEVGAVTQLSSGTGASVLAKYGYDALGRLTQTQDGATGTPIETYAYDATGNRTALTTAAGTASYTYPADTHRLLAINGESRSHDAAGNTTLADGKEFSFSDANRMSGIKQAGAVVESYGYNHLGERVLRIPAGGDRQITLYDEAGQWIGNYAATGEPQQQAVWLDNYPVALLGQIGSGVPELTYVQPDHLGTPRVVIDPVRDVAIWEWSSKSEVFGNQAPNADPDGDGVGFELALRFPGQQATNASGMFYNYQRDYDPVIGRYSQSDPVGLVGGISSYQYTYGRPVDVADPLGLRPLNAQEGSFIHSIFGECFDVDSIDLRITKNERASSLVGGRVDLQSRYFINEELGNGVNLADLHARAVFAHEVLHIWQRRQGAHLIAKLALPQAGLSIGIGDPYFYGSISSAGGAAMYFNDLFSRGKYEAQAYMWEKAYRHSDVDQLSSEVWDALRNTVASRSQCGCGQ
ncbi:RHS repeat-associated core domain-containing protein [Stenotrophomonas sp.]|uniref:RHS repeat-associated core domain-containing protein n=1 Tax=Stenotrophomonas sp. TaxID=69392 RepID=UPI002FC85F27